MLSFSVVKLKAPGTLHHVIVRALKEKRSSNIHHKFALIDQKVLWYGSIDLLSFGSAEESIMRLESPNITGELLKSMEKQGKR